MSLSGKINAHRRVWRQFRPPPHLGHLILAELAHDQLGLDRMVWVPAGDPPHKRDRRLTPAEYRIEMVRQSITGNASFQLSLIDFERTGPHYSSDMLRLLNEEYRGAELFFVIGGDSLRDLPTWHEPAQVIQYARLAVMRRPNTQYDLATLEEKIPDLSKRTLFLDSPLIEISARDLRQRVHNGRSIRYLVPDPVCEYIRLQNLYQNYED